MRIDSVRVCEKKLGDRSSYAYAIDGGQHWHCSACIRERDMSASSRKKPYPSPLHQSRKENS